MNSGSDCDRVRLQLMAAHDGVAMPGSVDPHSDPRQHLASCSSCDRWLREFESMNGRFQGVSYPGAQTDLWTTCFTPRELRLLAERSGLRTRGVWSVSPGAYARQEPTVETHEFLLVAERPQRPAA